MDIAPNTRAGASLIRNAGVGRKLFALAGFLLVALTVLSGVAWQSLDTLDGKARLAQAAVDTSIVPTETIHQGELKARMLVAAVAASSDAKAQKFWLDQIPGSDAEIAAAQQVYESHAAMPAYQSFKNLWARWLTLRDTKLLPLAEKRDPASRAAYDELAAGQAQDLVGKAADSLDALGEQNSAYVDGLTAAVGRARAGAVRTVLIVSLAALVLGLLLARWIARSIVAPIDRVRASLESLAAGDLTDSADVDSTDEVGRMAAALNAGLQLAPRNDRRTWPARPTCSPRPARRWPGPAP